MTSKIVILKSGRKFMFGRKLIGGEIQVSPSGKEFKTRAGALKAAKASFK